MALPDSILVSLCEQAGSRDEPARRFDRALGYFGSTTHQQTHPSVRTMAGDGWAHVTPVAQPGRPDRKVHEATEAGRSAHGLPRENPAEWADEVPAGTGK